jgi:membrane fusion protein, heavy metal efflux system
MRLWYALAATAVLLVVAGVLTHDRWRPWLFPAAAPAKDEHHHEDEDHVVLSSQAQANLRLDVRPLKKTDYPRTVELPGTVAELPGHSDRVVTAPVAGVVRRIEHAAWQSVKPGERLFTLGVVSEFLQNSQSALFKAMRDLDSVRRQREMAGSALPAARMLELESQEKRLETEIAVRRFELSSRGLTGPDIDRAARGQFVTEVEVQALATPHEHIAGERPHSHPADSFEVEEMKVQLGQRVEAGDVLCTLADHQHLGIEGHAFCTELPLVERLAREGGKVRAEWPGADGTWPAVGSDLKIRNVANVVEARSQTYPFYVPLVNEQKDYTQDGRAYRLWRYRPGQRVRLFLPAGTLKDVFELPRGAVVRDGAEHFVFQQNGDAFERQPVRVLYEDARNVVVAEGEDVKEGDHIAFHNAAALNRALKTQSEGGGHHHHHDH